MIETICKDHLNENYLITLDKHNTVSILNLILSKQINITLQNL